MTIDFSTINIWAALVGALVCFVLGALWYTVLFRALWIRVYQFTDEDIKDMEQRQNPAITFPAMLATQIITAIVLALVLSSLGITGIADSIGAAALLWLGLTGMTALTTQLGALRPIAGWAIDSGYHLACLLILGTILGTWH